MKNVTDFKGSKEIGDGNRKSGHIRGIILYSWKTYSNLMT